MLISTVICISSTRELAIYKATYRLNDLFTRLGLGEDYRICFEQMQYYYKYFNFNNCVI